MPPSLRNAFVCPGMALDNVGVIAYFGAFNELTLLSDNSFC